jgi:hypothetical protein
MVRALKTLLPRNAAVTSDFQNPTAVGQLLQDNPGELVQRYAGTLLQPLASGTGSSRHARLVCARTLDC